MLLIRYPQFREPERLYALRLVLEDFLGLDYIAEAYDGDTIQIMLRGDEKRKRIAMEDVFFAQADRLWLRNSSLPKPPLPFYRDADGTQYPVIYGRAHDGKYVDIKDNGARIGIDVFGSAFFMLTQYEEAVLPVRDQFDRFPAEASIACREGFLQRPIINEYAELLWAVAKRLWPELQRRPRQYRVLVSHDVDELSMMGRSTVEVLRAIGADLLRRRESALALRRSRAWWTSVFQRRIVDCDPSNTFDFIMRESDANGLRSAFYFVPAQSDMRLDPRYQLSNPWVLALIRRIYDRGHEVGLHASFNSYCDKAQLQREFLRLRRVCEEVGVRQETWGGRQHYLRWRNPTTWQNWEAAGLQYDSSLTYAQRPGFRCGCCCEYAVWSLEERRQLSLRERPLIVMEGSLLSYMGCPLTAVVECIRDLSRACRRVNGDFSLLWHNHMLVGHAAQETYSRVLREVA